MSASGGTKAVVAALLANLGIAASKFVAFAFTQSASMLSEGVHSLADSGNQVLLLIGGKRATRAASETHQFGYGRVRYVYGFVVSIILFLIGGAYSVYEGVHKFLHPEPLQWSTARIALVVLVVAIILESLSLRTALREVNAIRGRRTLWRFIRESRQPELPVVVLEDIGALTGLVFALGGVGTALVTGDGRWDGVGALAIGLLLVMIAFLLSIEMASMLVGESALREDQQAISEALATGQIVQRLIHLRTVYVGPDELLVAAKIAVDPELSAEQLSEGINQVEVAVRSAVPSARYVFIEPDIYIPQA